MCAWRYSSEQGCTNPRRQITVVTKFFFLLCFALPLLCLVLLLHLFHITVSRLYGFWKKNDSVFVIIIDVEFDKLNLVCYLYLFNAITTGSLCIFFRIRQSKKSTLFFLFIFCWPCLLLQILANDQLDALFHVFIYFICLHVSSITMLIIRRSKCINTSSGMISLCKWQLGMPVRTYTLTQTNHTRWCINTFWSPDDEHCDARNM